MNSKLVILGGGAAGVLIAMKLASQNIDVTLIDSKTFYEYTPALCSVLYEETDAKFHQHFSEISFELEPFLREINVEFILGNAKLIKDDKVFIHQQEEGIEYDYLVICTGSSYADPWKTQNGTECIDLNRRINFLNEQRDKYKQAQRILCIGGGPVGVEVATEISYRAPGKKITLVDMNKTVLANAPDGIGNNAQRILNARESITSIMEQSASQKGQEGNTYIYETDKSHTEIKADLVYNCIGVTPNSEFLQANHADWLNEKKQIIVDPGLRVTSNVFAVGDVNSVNEPKMFYTAHMQAIHFVRNMSRIIKNNTNVENLIPYHPSRPNMIVSMGPQYAIGYVSGIKLTGWPLGLNKGSHLASWGKYTIERVSMNSCHLKIPVNEVLYLTSRP
ncbi:uncharacterized protein EV154DRAFT_564127 [Mucor mucedo]|uniref:uncharacterized protein n=1 Tax=Mucor mucedo TaxID=29922 RepID=UPI00221FBC85|nr:uncharacterized protein EV154DRAFT_564127 [Mucor mucedo]KAI7890702.1 hypothetical protein EV154DRAFT_564127 [Mucor mucedo]